MRHGHTDILRIDRVDTIGRAQDAYYEKKKKDNRERSIDKKTELKERQI